MTTIDLTIETSHRANAIKRAKERNIIIPTYAQMKDPTKISAKVKEDLKGYSSTKPLPYQLA
jgi:cysteine synthase